MAAGDIVVFDEAKAYLIDGGFEGADVVKVALVTNAVVPTASDAVPSMGGGTTNYTEVTGGTSYTAGGETLDTLANCVTEAAGTMTFDDTGANVTWAQDASGPVNIYYAIIYNDTDATNRAIAFVDMGGPVSLQSGAVTITWNASGIFTIA